MTKTDAWFPVIFLFGVALLGSVVQFANSAAAWKDVFTGLYYIPIVIAAINLGTRAAITVALVSGICYAIASAVAHGDPWIRPFTETILFVSVGIAAARMTQIHEGLNARRAPSKGSFHIETAFQSGQSGQSIQQMPGFSQIVAGIIRRFRTPVSSIEGAVWLLEDAHFPDDKRQEFLKIIRKESQILNTALSDILEFTQPRSPKLACASLSRILDEAIELAGPKDHGHFFLFRKDLPSDIPSLKVDQEMMGKVFLNLARNAIQATPGGGEIVFSARLELGNVIVSVKDRGKGIPPHAGDRIFDPFFTTREHGLGLGLTVARQIVAAHGGTMAVEENQDRGTCVSVVLPLRPPNPHEHGSHTGG